ncbi:MAG: AAA family ATPase [bacterium]|nr:AAA family ATPase [bacterium]
MYISGLVLKKAFETLGDLTDRSGKKPIEVTSAIRYLLAASSLLKKTGTTSADLSINAEDNRQRFVTGVGEVVALSEEGHYTANFLSEWANKSDYATGNNFLTTRLKTDGNYPGRPTPLLKIDDEQVSILPDIEDKLSTGYNLDRVRVALVIWLFRNEEFERNGNPREQLIEKTVARYETLVATSLEFSTTEWEQFLTANGLTPETIFSDEKPSFDAYIPKRKDKPTHSAVSPAGVGRNVIIFGCPGSGKSYRASLMTSGQPRFTTTFHPEYSYSDFVGSYKPVDNGTRILYAFVPRIFIDSYVEAWKNPEVQVFLVIEEINRGNCAAIFGDLFQLLDRNPDGFSEYWINVDSDMSTTLKGLLGSAKEYADILTRIREERGGMVSADPYSIMILPSNLNIIATMNTSDQSLFPMDSAFKRRWQWEYSPIDYDDADQFVIELSDSNYSWGQFLRKINAKVHSITESEDKQLGNRFINSSSYSIRGDQFISKVMFYLWFDVFKNEDPTDENYIFRTDLATTFTFQDVYQSEAVLKSFFSFNGIEPIARNDLIR